ncbi:MAG TPA: M1 family aminopeptidase [Candidatus Limnocylindria bacterium]|nr:M1 family aminopeptidase [Candidatus Limnocylindria bacterium]
MQKTCRPLLVALLLSRSLLGADISLDERDQTDAQCLKTASFFAAGDPAGPRSYAPDREVRIKHIALDITPDFKARTIVGRVETRFQPNQKPVSELKLDAVDLTIRSVTSTEPIRAWQAVDGKLVITFASPLSGDRESVVTVEYSAEPTKGLYFRTPEMGYKPGEAHLFTQGEAIDSRNWYPCFDAPNEKLTSEVTCHVPEGMTVISNGRLLSQQKDPATGLVAVHWSQEKPHANYLITLAAGQFRQIEDKHGDIPLAFVTLPSEIDQAASSFRDTKDMMTYFEAETGVPYPWAKYYQICVNDFVEGGMENTSATTLTDSTLFTEATENIQNSESLVSHELAHQWFGDLVTCRDWSDVWLNEGFATYYQVLYDGHKNGRDSMLYELYRNAKNVTGQANDTTAIVNRTYGDPMNQFGYLAYPKGGWVLHMLRSQLGEELYRKVIKTYLTRHAYQNVHTEDLRAVVQELSGRSFDLFFDQWVYHAHHPELEVSYGWDEKTQLAKVTVRQAQQVSAQVLLFDFPLTLRFKGAAGPVDKVIRVHEKEEDFFFPFDAAPKGIRIDPDYTLLAVIKFDLTREMCRTQLADKSDMMGRLLAVEKLSKDRGHEVVAMLKETLNQDPFFAVRQMAASALAEMHTDEAFDALLASTTQPDARVRLRVVSSIAGFYRETAYTSVRDVLTKEKNPMIIAEAVRGLAPYAKPETKDTLVRLLNTDSYRDRLTEAAISAMRQQDDPAYITSLLDRLDGHGAGLSGRAFASGLDALAYLARNEEKKDQVREFLLAHVHDLKRNVATRAMSALGTLGDTKAIAVLQTFARASKESPERKAAEGALTTLRAVRKPVDDFKNLRQEVLDLQKESRELRKTVDELKDKLQAQGTAAPKTTSKSPKATVGKR